MHYQYQLFPENIHGKVKENVHALFKTIPQKKNDNNNNNKNKRKLAPGQNGQ